LLLAALLLIGTVIYASVEAASFAKEAERIEQTLREYVESSPQMAILPTPYNRQGSEAPAQTVSRKMAENELFLRSFFTFSTDSEGYNQGEAILSQVREAVDYNAKGLGSITGAKGIIPSVHSIQRLGANRAEVSFSYTGSVRYMGDVRWVLFFGSRRSTGPGDPESGERRAIPSGEVTAVLVREEGVWKIDAIVSSTVTVD